MDLLSTLGPLLAEFSDEEQATPNKNDVKEENGEVDGMPKKAPTRQASPIKQPTLNSEYDRLQNLRL